MRNFTRCILFYFGGYDLHISVVLKCNMKKHTEFKYVNSNSNYIYTHTYTQAYITHIYDI